MKTNRSIRFHLRTPALLTILLIVLPSVLNASGSPAFSNGSLKGSYSVLMNNWTSDPSRTEDLVGVFNFDGTSKVSITSFTDNKVGTLTTGTGSGTYSVNAEDLLEQAPENVPHCIGMLRHDDRLALIIDLRRMLEVFPGPNI